MRDGTRRRIDVLVQRIESNSSQINTLKGYTLKGYTFKGSTFKGSTLKGSTFKGSTLKGSTFKGATLKGSTLKGSKTAQFRRPRRCVSRETSPASPVRSPSPLSTGPRISRSAREPHRRPQSSCRIRTIPARV